jgi:hypothetical protein
MRMLPTASVALAVLLACAPPVFSQAHMRRVPAPQPSIESHRGELMTSHCAAIAERDPRLAPLSRLCEFVQSYRQSLPNFICEERTISTARWLGAPPTTVIEQQVTLLNGIERISNLRVNGAPADPSKSLDMTFLTHGEFGNEFIDVFDLAMKTEFHYERRTKLRGVDALEFSFHIAQQNNHLWKVEDGRTTEMPEFSGKIWVDSLQSRLLRLANQPLKLPREFLIQSAEKQTDYGDVDLGERGKHLLPVHARSHGCLRALPPEGILTRMGAGRSLPRCVTNTIEFSGCRKFVGKAKILEETK